jgi:hypothetical protein
VRLGTKSGKKAKKVSEAKAADVKVLVAALVKQGVVTDGAIQLGKTKVFMKTAIWNALEVKKDEVASELILSAQAVARGFVARLRYQKCALKLKELRMLTADMNQGKCECDPQKLEATLEIVTELLPYPKSKSVKETAAAAALLAKLKKDAAALVAKLETVTKTCSKAKGKTKEKEVAAMKAVLAEVDAANGEQLAKGFTSLAKVLKEAKSLRKKLEKEEKARKEAEAEAAKKAADAKAKAEKAAAEKAEKAEKAKALKAKQDSEKASKAKAKKGAEEAAQAAAEAEAEAEAEAASAKAASAKAEETAVQEPSSESEESEEEEEAAEEEAPVAKGGVGGGGDSGVKGATMDQGEKGAVKVVSGSSSVVGEYEIQFDCAKLGLSFCTSTDRSSGNGCMKVKMVSGVATGHAGVLTGDIILHIGVLHGRSYKWASQQVVGRDSQKALANMIRAAPRPLRLKMRRPASGASVGAERSRGGEAAVGNAVAEGMMLTIGEAEELKETSSGMFKSSTYFAFPVHTTLPDGNEASVIRKRYSEFDKLYKKVTKEKGLAVLSLPAKTSGKLDAHALAQRKQGLEIFLVSIKEANSPTALQHLLEFLEIESDFRDCERERA